MKNVYPIQCGDVICRVISIVVFVTFFSLNIYGQQKYSLDLNVQTIDKIPTTGIKKGENLEITSVSCDTRSRKGFNYVLQAKTENGQDITIDLSKIHEMPIVYEANSKDSYWQYRTIQQTLPSLSRMHNAYSLRNKAEINANSYVKALKDNNLIYEDPFLTSYINSLLVKINPSQRLDFFKYNFRVVVVKDNEPNAGIYPNGALLINAGLLARIHTEDELVAILCHEANHFICNHYLENMAKIQLRENIGAIGSAVAGVAAGILTRSASMGVNVASMSLDLSNDLNKLITAMGLAFSKTQERECDQAAIDLLPILGYDINGMATSIQRIGDYYLEEGNLEAYYKSGNHPKIEDRIAATGVPYERQDIEFEKKMAPCVTYVAQLLYTNGRYSQAIQFVNQNINNGVGRGIDYYIKGECLLAAFDSEETNNEAKLSLLKAKETYSDGLPTLKALIIADLRLGNKAEAIEQLHEFIKLTEDKEEEKIWAQNMLMNI